MLYSFAGLKLHFQPPSIFFLYLEAAQDPNGNRSVD